MKESVEHFSEKEPRRVYTNGIPALIPPDQWAAFAKQFTVLEAAGGVVQNPSGELLVFYRRGSWDMPKGKIDPGETPEQAALREVEEETGLRHLTLGAFVMHTYHTYEQKGKQYLKKTWWYRMTTAQNDTIPQTEEDIEEIRWVNPSEWLETEKAVYGSIRDVIEMAGLNPSGTPPDPGTISGT